MTTSRSIRYRTRPVAADVVALRRLVAATGVFYDQERVVALELLDARLAHGPKSGYLFFFAERHGEVLGYAAWGPVPLTERS